MYISLLAQTDMVILTKVMRFITFSTLGTYSYQNTDLTFGLGFGANDGEVSDPIALFGLQTRLRERLSFVTENLIFTRFRILYWLPLGS